MSSLLASFTKRCPEQTQEAVQLAMFGTDLRCAMRCPGLTYGTALPEAWWDSSPSSQKSNSGALRSKPPRSKSHYPYPIHYPPVLPSHPCLPLKSPNAFEQTLDLDKES
eukprot:3240559-Rhodomonas_salina.2